MSDYQIGDIAISLAGHDKNQRYIILSVEKTFVWVCDGRIRTLNNPKKKNIKHIQIIKVKDNPIKASLAENRLRDEEIKYFLKVFGGNKCLNRT